MNLALRSLWHLSLCLRVLATDTRQSGQPLAPAKVDVEVDNGTFGYYPVYDYVTEERLNGPKTNFIQWNERCDDGLLYFLTPRGWGITNPGPMILDRHGKLVWAKHFDNKFGGQAYDFMVQEYQGEHFLTFWLGDDRVRGHGSGFYYMLNSSYDVVHRVGAANGLSADLHEFLITPQGTALLTMYEIVEHKLADVPDYNPGQDPAGPSYIWDCVFQEVVIETGSLVHEWRASDHVNVTSSFRGIGPGGSKNDPFDWFHLNSVDKDDIGNYLISARYTHSISYINGESGNIIWTLGGYMNDFLDLSDGDGLNFAWQHDARFLPTDTFPNMYNPPPQRDGFTTRLLTLFDNAAEDQHYEWGLPVSRALLLEVTYPNERTIPVAARNLKSETWGDEPNRNVRKAQEINGTSTDYTVRVIKSYVNPQEVRSSSQGSMQILPQGPEQDPKVFVGYGLNAVWTEFDADGTVLCDVHYGAVTSWERGDIQSYRTYKFPWTGTPEQPPKADITDDDVEVFVSWNGATEVADWVLQCSDNDTDSEMSWADIVRVPKDDFETSIVIPAEIDVSRYLRVIALDRGGRRIPNGASEPIDRGVVASYFPRLTGKFPHRVSIVSPPNLFLILVCTICTVFLLFGAYRRYLSYKLGHRHQGPLRWRKGAAYRLLGDA